MESYLGSEIDKRGCSSLRSCGGELWTAVCGKGYSSSAGKGTFSCLSRAASRDGRRALQQGGPCRCASGCLERGEAMDSKQQRALHLRSGPGGSSLHTGALGLPAGERRGWEAGSEEAGGAHSEAEAKQ